MIWWWCCVLCVVNVISFSEYLIDGSLLSKPPLIILLVLNSKVDNSFDIGGVKYVSINFVSM